jgi:rhodanese-related sulfurtransferase
VEEFEARGFTNVKALEGGVEGWKNSLAKAKSSTG